MAPGFTGESGIIRRPSKTEAKKIRQEKKETQESRPFFYLTFRRGTDAVGNKPFANPEYNGPFEMNPERTPRKEGSNEVRVELSAKNEAAIEEVLKLLEIKGRVRFDRTECQLIVDDDNSNFSSREARREFQDSLLKALEERGVMTFYVQSLGDDSLIWAVVDKATFDVAKGNQEIKTW